METSEKKPNSLFSSHNIMMALCCVAMVGAFFLFTGSGAQSSLFGLILPLAACLGMHIIMHKMMGKSCHESDKKEPIPGKSSMPDSGTVKPLSKS